MIGVVLAGGESRRLGRDKALLRRPDGRTLLERTVALLREAGLSEIAISVSSPARAEELRAAIPALADSRVVIDEVQGAGPLAALCSALRAFPYRPVLLAACDLPRLEAAAPRLLLREWAGMDDEYGGEGGAAMLVPVVEGHRQPLLALYGPGCLPVAVRLLAEGRRAMRDLLDAPELRPRWLEGEPLIQAGITLDNFANLNAPGDLAALLGADG